MRDSSASRAVFGLPRPLTHSHTVGCLTPTNRANSVWESLLSFKYCFSRCMLQNISVIYNLSIAESYATYGHCVAVQKDYELSVFERAEQAACEKLKKAKVTQNDLAKLAGISQPSVREWKVGGPRVEVARDFSKNTGICVEWLYSGLGPKRPPPAPNSHLGRLYDRWNELSDFTKGRIIQAMEDDTEAGTDFREKHG